MKKRTLLSLTLVMLSSLFILCSCTNTEVDSKEATLPNFPDYTYEQYIENNKENAKIIIKTLEESKKATASEALAYFEEKKKTLNLKVTYAEAIRLIPEAYLKEHKIPFKYDQYREISLEDLENKEEVIHDMKAFMAKNYPNLDKTTRYFKSLMKDMGNEENQKAYRALGVVYTYKDGNAFFFDPLGIIKIEKGPSLP